MLVSQTYLQTRKPFKIILRKSDGVFGMLSEELYM